MPPRRRPLRQPGWSLDDELQPPPSARGVAACWSTTAMALGVPAATRICDLASVCGAPSLRGLGGAGWPEWPRPRCARREQPGDELMRRSRPEVAFMIVTRANGVTPDLVVRRWMLCCARLRAHGPASAVAGNLSGVCCNRRDVARALSGPSPAAQLLDMTRGRISLSGRWPRDFGDGAERERSRVADHGGGVGISDFIGEATRRHGSSLWRFSEWTGAPGRGGHGGKVCLPAAPRAGDLRT